MKNVRSTCESVAQHTSPRLFPHTGGMLTNASHTVVLSEWLTFHDRAPSSRIRLDANAIIHR
jgi:hypothetical protein